MSRSIKHRAKIAFYDAKCFLFKKSRQTKNLFRTKTKHQYLFVLSPPYCGSTLLNELLSSSPNISSSNIFGTREGLGLREVRKLINYRQHWNDDYPFQWEKIKKEWLKYWDHSKAIFLDKSQPALIRATAIEVVFEPCFFIALVRDPSALCESYMRRDKMSSQEAADYTIRCLKAQYNNCQQLKNVLILKYEDLVNDTPTSIQHMIDFLPSIERIPIKASFKAHNFKNKAMPIVNLNKEKVDRLSSKDKKIIFDSLQAHQSLLSFLGYHNLEEYL